MLWLALHFPALALDLFADEAADHPFALHQPEQGRPRIYACNRAARAAGIEPGMALASAHGLLPALTTRPRDPAAEAAALNQLTDWAYQFSAEVSPQPPADLLLEVGGSLTLFGGLDRLRGQLRDGLRQLGFRARSAVAPNPSAARLLARTRQASPLLDPADLAATLDPLPLTLLEIDPARQRTLRGLGLRLLGDCRRLPRAGLARRLGPELIDHIDRLYGLRPEPLTCYTPPQRFSSKVLLPTRVETTSGLQFALNRLLLTLIGLLRGHTAAVQQLTLHLELDRGGRDTIAFNLVRPNRDHDHLQKLLQERLDRHRLGAAVEAMVLESGEFQSHGGEADTLFISRSERGIDVDTLRERLAARLGDEALQQLALAADHRPERAWREGIEDTYERYASGERPLWLLEPARPVVEVVSGGMEKMELLDGPERVESGWWDEFDCVRDYFIGRSARHGRYWLYRRRDDGNWFVQGIFA